MIQKGAHDVSVSVRRLGNMNRARKLAIVGLNEHLTCTLCRGYFVDATTIIECLHSFCRSCIVKYLQSNKYCPICDVQVHKSKPLLNIRPDKILQNIVYKLVPKLYQNEMLKRKKFYALHPESKPSDIEERGEASYQHILSPDENICVSLNYYGSTTTPRYLQCSAALSVFHIQKLIRSKYDLNNLHKVDILYNEDCLNNYSTLIDIAYSYLWRRKGPLELTYKIYKNTSQDGVSGNAELLGGNNNNNDWKEVQIQISENGEMSVTGIQDCLDLLDKMAEDEGEEPEKLSGKTTEKIPGKIVEKSEKTVEKVPGKAEEEILGKTVEKILGKTVEKILGKTVEKMEESVENRSASDKEMQPSEKGAKLGKKVTKSDPKIVKIDLESRKCEGNSKLDQVQPKIKKIEQKLNKLETKLNKTVEKQSNLIENKGEVVLPAKTENSSNKTENSSNKTEISIKTLAETESSSKTTSETSEIPQITLPPVKLTKIEKRELNKVANQLETATPPPVKKAKKELPELKFIGKLEERELKIIQKRLPLKKNGNKTEKQVVEIKSDIVVIPTVDLTLNSPSKTKSGDLPAENAQSITSNSENKVVSTISQSSCSSNKRKLVEPQISEIVEQPPVKQSKPTILNHSLTLHNLSNNHPLKKHSRNVTNIDITDKSGKTLVAPPQNNNNNKLATSQSNSNWNAVPLPPVLKSYSPVITVPKVRASTSKFPEIPPVLLNSSVKGGKPVPVGYKTLKDPPKSWNPQVKQVKEGGGGGGGVAVVVSPRTANDLKNVRPAKFFKVRNNMPRYLGCPASGVKPMYQVHVSPDKDKDKDKVGGGLVVMETPIKTEIKKHSIVKIDPKTLKPISEKAPECSNLSKTDLKINTSNTVSIINPLKLQSDSRKSPHSPNKKSSSSGSSPPAAKPRLEKQVNLNYTPPNPFIPNLQSPTLNPNQFLFPGSGFHYDPRYMSAYHHPLLYGARLPFPTATTDYTKVLISQSQQLTSPVQQLTNSAQQMSNSGISTQQLSNVGISAQHLSNSVQQLSNSGNSQQLTNSISNTTMTTSSHSDNNGPFTTKLVNIVSRGGVAKSPAALQNSGQKSSKKHKELNKLQNAVDKLTQNKIRESGGGGGGREEKVGKSVEVVTEKENCTKSSEEKLSSCKKTSEVVKSSREKSNLGGSLEIIDLDPEISSESSDFEVKSTNDKVELVKSEVKVSPTSGDKKTLDLVDKSNVNTIASSNDSNSGNKMTASGENEVILKSKVTVDPKVDRKESVDSKIDCKMSTEVTEEVETVKVDTKENAESKIANSEEKVVKDLKETIGETKVAIIETKESKVAINDSKIANKESKVANKDLKVANKELTVANKDLNISTADSKDTTTNYKVVATIESIVSNSEVFEGKTKNSDITKSKVANSDVLESKVANSEVIERKISNSEVIRSKMGNSEVLESKVANSEVLERKVSNSEVISGKVAHSEALESKGSHSEVTKSNLSNSEVVECKIVEKKSDEDKTKTIEVTAVEKVAETVKKLPETSGTIPLVV